MKVNYIKSQIIKDKELKRTLRCDNDVRISTKIKQLSRLEGPLMVFQIGIV